MATRADVEICCLEGDEEKLFCEAIGEEFEIAFQDASHEGWGHHGVNVVIRTKDDRWVHADCGGCSCDGSGDWGFYESKEEAMRHVPEDVRERYA